MESNPKNPKKKDKGRFDYLFEGGSTSEVFETVEELKGNRRKERSNLKLPESVLKAQIIQEPSEE